VDRELIEHAARVLRTAPGRIMEGRALYDRVSRETGIRCGLGLLLQQLHDFPDRFSMLQAAPAHDGSPWTAGERRSYAGLLPLLEKADAAMVALCEPDPDAGAVAQPTESDGLAAVHQSVAELLRCPGADAHFRAAVASAVAALGATPATSAASAASAGPCVKGQVREAARSTTAPRRPRPR
jgi:hypothetical protein